MGLKTKIMEENKLLQGRIDNLENAQSDLMRTSMRNQEGWRLESVDYVKKISELQATKRTLEHKLMQDMMQENARKTKKQKKKFGLGKIFSRNKEDESVG